jgi:hypothetical protein
MNGDVSHDLSGDWFDAGERLADASEGPPLEPSDAGPRLRLRFALALLASGAALTAILSVVRALA